LKLDSVKRLIGISITRIGGGHCFSGFVRTIEVAHAIDRVFVDGRTRMKPLESPSSDVSLRNWVCSCCAWDGWLRLTEYFIAEQGQGVPMNTVEILL